MPANVPTPFLVVGFLITLVSGGAMGALITWYATNCRERRRDRQEFASAIGAVRERIELATNPSAKRAETLDALIGPYHQFRFRVCRSHRPALEQAWKNYRDMPEDQLAPRAFDSDPATMVRLRKDDYEEARHTILSLLDGLLEFTR